MYCSASATDWIRSACLMAGMGGFDSGEMTTPQTSPRRTTLLLCRKPDGSRRPPRWRTPGIRPVSPPWPWLHGSPFGAAIGASDGFAISSLLFASKRRRTGLVWPDQERSVFRGPHLGVGDRFDLMTHGLPRERRPLPPWRIGHAQELASQGTRDFRGTVAVRSCHGQFRC